METNRSILLSFVFVVSLIFRFRLSSPGLVPPVFSVKTGFDSPTFNQPAQAFNPAKLQPVKFTFAPPELISYPNGFPHQNQYTPLIVNGTEILGKCNTCDFSGTIKAASTERDLVLIYSQSWTDPFVSFVSSLRAVGCKATIAVLTTRKDLYVLQPNECHVSVYYIAHTDEESPDREQKSPDKFRWELFYHFLSQENVKGKYDRVFVAEDHSIAFSDPFTIFNIDNPKNSNNLLYFIEDTNKVESSEAIKGSLQCHLNAIYFDNVDLDFNLSIIDHEKSFSTTIAGGYNEIVSFLGVMFHSPAWDDCFQTGFDQGMLVLAYHFYYKKQHNTKVNWLGCRSGFVSMTVCNSLFPQVNDILNGIKNTEKPELTILPSSYVHQAQRLPALGHYIDMVCPPKSTMKKNQ